MSAEDRRMSVEVEVEVEVVWKGHGDLNEIGGTKKSLTKKE
jgi:hypothetical protein